MAVTPCPEQIEKPGPTIRTDTNWFSILQQPTLQNVGNQLRVTLLQGSAHRPPRVSASQDQIILPTPMAEIQANIITPHD